MQNCVLLILIPIILTVVHKLVYRPSLVKNSMIDRGMRVRDQPYVIRNRSVEHTRKSDLPFVTVGIGYEQAYMHSTCTLISLQQIGTKRQKRFCNKFHCWRDRLSAACKADWDLNANQLETMNRRGVPLRAPLRFMVCFYIAVRANRLCMLPAPSPGELNCVLHIEWIGVNGIQDAVRVRRCWRPQRPSRLVARCR